MTQPYDLDALRAAYELWEDADAGTPALRAWEEFEPLLHDAARSGLLNDAALGRDNEAAMVALGDEIEALRTELERRRKDAEIGERVRAAAERDGPEREAMDAAIAQTFYYGLPGGWGTQAQAAARALIAMQEVR